MENPPGPREFATTHWSLVEAARTDKASHPQAREALEALCRTYWYPLYAYARRRGLSAEDAQDVTQGFFAKMLEKSMPMVVASFYAWLDWPEYHFYWTYHGGNNSVFNAASYVNPELDPVTRTLKVRLRFDNAGAKLLPNMFARVVIDGAQHQFANPRLASSLPGLMTRICSRHLRRSSARSTAPLSQSQAASSRGSC